MKASRSVSYSEKSPTCPLKGSLSARSDNPCPRQSSVATANPRARKSRTVSKYFSMNSARPWNRHTVPLRPGGGAHRAKRNETPSGVFKVPDTTSSGAGLAGIEMRVMTCRKAARPSHGGELLALYQHIDFAQCAVLNYC